MAYSEDYDHYHVVSICVECAEIGILAIAKDDKALKKFFDTIEPELIRAITTSPVSPKNVEFTVEIVVPNQIATITPKNGHEQGHVVVAIAHKCVDDYNFCYDKQKELSIKKLASQVAMQFFDNLQSHLNEDTSKKSSDDQARRLLESLDLPEDLFGGIN